MPDVGKGIAAGMAIFALVKKKKLNKKNLLICFRLILKMKFSFKNK